MADPDYDPEERHRRYLASRQLKGRVTGTQSPPRTPTRDHPTGSKPTASKPTRDTPQEAQARVGRLKAKIATLEGSLTKAMAALADKRRSAAKTEKENSDGKTTVQERQAAKESRDKNQAKNASEAKKDAASKGGSASAKARDAATLSVDELESRVSSIKSALSSARKQLSEAQSAAGLSHSSDTSAIEFRFNDRSYIRGIAHALGFLEGVKTQLDAHQSRKESVHMDADFGGYVTRHDVQCADGRTILPGAFQEQDGMTVPLVWSHDRSRPDNILGHCKLEYRSDGVYGYAYFNKAPSSQSAKEAVQHGDLKFLSIFANNLKEKIRAGMAHLKDVEKGKIREVSLVLGGANPGAFIDNINFAHSDGSIEVDESEAIITMGTEIELTHADSGDDEAVVVHEEKSVQDILKTLNTEQTDAVNYLLLQALGESEGDDVQHGDDTEDGTTDGPAEGAEEGSEDGAGDVVATDTEATEEGNEGVVEGESTDAAAGDNEEGDAAAGDADTGNNDEAGDDVQHDDNSQEDNSMTHNVFDQAKGSKDGRPTATLSHSDVQSIIADAEEIGSLKKAVERFVSTKGVTVNGELSHGIENIEYLFPDAQLLESSPAFISRRMEWVDKVLNGVRKSPISRIKTLTADITPDEARARGYVKGNMKNEEFFALSKRETTPQTIYKKQKLDRDDVVDITTLDVVAWLKAEMKVMLDEEIAGAILVGDGRSNGDDDKIFETKIRPIASDAELYVTTAWVNLDDASSTVEELVEAVINNRRYYKGSGQPTFFTTETIISAFLTVKDNFGRRLYQSLAEVAAVLRVSEIVPVEVMERVSDLVGIMVNLSDYTLGADKGGQATMFDDFDIDYNKLRYLIETRLSGALTTPKAAIVFRKTVAASVLVVPVEPTFDEEASTVTVATTTGITYKNADTNATLTTGAPVELDEGEVLHVIAIAGANKHFANNVNDEWTFTGVATA